MKTYVLIHAQNSTTFGYWYGWYDGKKAKWSYWKDSIKDAIKAELKEDDEEEAEALEEYKKALSKNTVILYESTEPIDFETFQRKYPEYLV